MCYDMVIPRACAQRARVSLDSHCELVVRPFVKLELAAGYNGFNRDVIG